MNLSEEPTATTMPRVHEPDVQYMEDRILTLAFDRVTRTMKVRTMVVIFAAGMVTGMVLLGILGMIMISMAGQEM